MAYVIVHARMGIYLRGFWGMGFWSKLNPVGQPAAVTFESVEEAKMHMNTWENPPQDVRFVEVTADDGGCYASIQACVNAGLDRWEV